jgi:hypothetical protein
MSWSVGVPAWTRLVMLSHYMTACHDQLSRLYVELFAHPFTYDHRILRARLPVRSALDKQDTGGLVVRWVTTSESPLLYVFGKSIFLLTRGVYGCSSNFCLNRGLIE